MQISLSWAADIVNPAEHSVLSFAGVIPAHLSHTLRLKNPAAERKRPGEAVAISLPMSYQPFVAAAPMGDAAVEVFTILGDLAGKGAIPRPRIEQADMDLDIATSKAKIGLSAFDAAYDSGKAMTVDEAVASALGAKDH